MVLPEKVSRVLVTCQSLLNWKAVKAPEVLVWSLRLFPQQGHTLKFEAKPKTDWHMPCFNFPVLRKSIDPPFQIKSYL